MPSSTFIWNKDRERNLVILGILEDPEALEGATTDIDKLKKVWDAAGITCSIKSIQRLGQTGGSRRRPVLAVVESRADRDTTLEKAKNLKTSTETYKRIFIKKDVHPSVRAEWKRLHEVVQREKERPENTDCNIILNFRERKVYKDSVMIDQWNMQSF